MGNTTPAGNTPVGTTTMDHQAPNPQATLLQQAQTFQHYSDIAPRQQNFPAPCPANQTRTTDAYVGSDSGNGPRHHPVYLNPFGERLGREPSPVRSRPQVSSRELTHVRSSSDPVYFARDNNPLINAVSQGSPGVPGNLVPTNQGQRSRRNVAQVSYRQDMHPVRNTFPKWNPFSDCSDFVLNTETTDEDFASLREPAAVFHSSQQTSLQHTQRQSNQVHAPQVVSGNVQSQYAPPRLSNSLNVPTTGHRNPSNNAENSSLSSKSSGRSSDSDGDLVEARPIMYSNLEEDLGHESMYEFGRRKNDAFVEAPVNAGCDVDEVTTMFDRRAKLHGPSRVSGRHTAANVFDDAPFQKPGQGNVVKSAVVLSTSPGRDPFGSAPFRQKEAAKLARKQARRSRERTGGDESRGRRVLPTVPTQARV